MRNIIKYILIASCCLGAGVLIGRFTKSAEVITKVETKVITKVETKEIKDEAYTQQQIALAKIEWQKNIHSTVVTHTVYQPCDDGTTVPSSTTTTTTIDENSSGSSNSNSTTNTSGNSTTTTDSTTNTTLVSNYENIVKNQSNYTFGLGLQLDTVDLFKNGTIKPIPQLVAGIRVLGPFWLDSGMSIEKNPRFLLTIRAEF